MRLRRFRIELERALHFGLDRRDDRSCALAVPTQLAVGDRADHPDIRQSRMRAGEIRREFKHLSEQGLSPVKSLGVAPIPSYPALQIKFEGPRVQWRFCPGGGSQLRRKIFRHNSCDLVLYG